MPLNSLNRLTKWRVVFAGWQLGTRPKGDPDCDAVRDHRELTILLRAEVSTLTGLLLRKGLGYLNDEKLRDLTPEQRHAAVLAWIDKHLIVPVP